MRWLLTRRGYETIDFDSNPSTAIPYFMSLQSLYSLPLRCQTMPNILINHNNVSPMCYHNQDVQAAQQQECYQAKTLDRHSDTGRDESIVSHDTMIWCQLTCGHQWGAGCGAIIRPCYSNQKTIIQYACTCYLQSRPPSVVQFCLRAFVTASQKT